MFSRKSYFWMIVFAFLINHQIVGDEDKSADESTDKNKHQTEWVVQVRPGVKRYGKTSKFSEVGQVQSFDASPVENHLAFGAGDGIKIWSNEDERIIRKIGDSHSTVISYMPDGVRLVASHWKDNSYQLVMYNVLSGESHFTVNPIELFKQQKQKSVADDNDTENDDEQDEQVEEVENFYVQFLVVSPDGSRIAAGDGRRSLILDSKDGELIRCIKHESYSNTLSFLNEDEIVDGRGRIFDCESGESEKRLPKRIFGEYQNSLKVSPQNPDLICVTQWNSGIKLYDRARKRLVELERPDSGKASNYLVSEFSGNGDLVAGATYSYNYNGGTPKFCEIHVWDAESGELKNRFKTRATGVSLLKFSADNQSLFSKNYVQIGVTSWDLSEKEKTIEHQGHSSQIHQLTFSPDDETLLTAAQQGTAIFFDLESGEPERTVPCQQSSHVGFCRSGRYATIGANYNALYIFDTKKNRSKSVNVRSFSRPSVISRLGGFLTRRKQTHSWENYAISCVVNSEDEKAILTGLRGQKTFRVETYSISTGKNVGRKKFKMKDFWELPQPVRNEAGVEINQHSQMQWVLNSIAVAPNGQLVAILNDELELFVIDVETGVVVHELGDCGQHAGMSRIYFSPDSTKLVFIDRQVLKLWDVDSGDEINIESKLKNVSAVAFNSEHSSMAMIGYNPTKLTILETENWSEKFSSKLEGNGFPSLAISNDGDTVALALQNGQFEIWDLNEVEPK